MGRLVLCVPIPICAAQTELSLPAINFSTTASRYCNLVLSSWTITKSSCLIVCFLCPKHWLNCLKEVKFLVSINSRTSQWNEFVHSLSHVVSIKVIWVIFVFSIVEGIRDKVHSPATYIKGGKESVVLDHHSQGILSSVACHSTWLRFPL